MHLLRFAGINAAQNCQQPITQWQPAEYQTNSSSLGDPNGTPLGFRRGLTIPNPELMPQWPCVGFTIQSSIQYIEVLVKCNFDSF